MRIADDLQFPPGLGVVLPASESSSRTEDAASVPTALIFHAAMLPLPHPAATEAPAATASSLCLVPKRAPKRCIPPGFSQPLQPEVAEVASAASAATRSIHQQTNLQAGEASVIARLSFSATPTASQLDPYHNKYLALLRQFDMVSSSSSFVVTMPCLNNFPGSFLTSLLMTHDLMEDFPAAAAESVG